MPVSYLKIKEKEGLKVIEPKDKYEAMGEFGLKLNADMVIDPRYLNSGETILLVYISKDILEAYFSTLETLLERGVKLLYGRKGDKKNVLSLAMASEGDLGFKLSSSGDSSYYVVAIPFNNKIIEKTNNAVGNRFRIKDLSSYQTVEGEPKINILNFPLHWEEK